MTSPTTPPHQEPGALQPAGSTPVTPGHPGDPVCILGLGLIGGSLLRDLTAAGVPAFGWNRSTVTVDAACADGFDVSGDLISTLTRAENCDALIVLGVPVPALTSMLSAVSTHAPTCGITDVTSVKGEVLRLVEDAGLADRFVGGHPMAGTANSGWSATTEGLFRNAVWVVATDGAPEDSHQSTDAAATDAEWLRTWCRVIDMANLTGASVVPARSRTHDQAVARISHLPHILAEALAITADRGGALALSLAASSFRDGTRVAGTEPSLVRAMCENNRESLVTALDETIALLTTARENLADRNHDIADLATAGCDARLRYEARAGREQGDGPNRPLILLRPGNPGWLDQLHEAEATGSQITVLKI